MTALTTPKTPVNMFRVLLCTPMLCKEKVSTRKCLSSARVGHVCHADQRGTHLEDGGRIVVNGVDTGSILPEEEHAAEEQTPHDIGASGKGLEGFPETDADSRSLVLMGLVNGGNFFCDVHIICIQLANPAEVLHGLLALVVKEQPARGFPNPQGTYEKQAGRDYLDGKWNEPLLMVIRQGLLNTVLLSSKVSILQISETGNERHDSRLSRSPPYHQPASLARRNRRDGLEWRAVPTQKGR
jgi:hypothetical protein